MFVCPSILDTVSMGTPFDSVVVVANVCRARWNVRGHDVQLLGGEAALAHGADVVGVQAVAQYLHYNL